MPIFAAAQQQDGKWRVFSGSVARGYCAAYAPVVVDPNQQFSDPEEQAENEAAVAAANAAYSSLVNKHHTTGHNTEAEALACHREFVLDTRLHLDVSLNAVGAPNVESACASCATMTSRVAVWDGIVLNLCPTHMTRAHVETLYP